MFLRSFSPAEIIAAGRHVQLYEVTKNFSYVSDKLGRTITVPGRPTPKKSGYVTDFAHIPRALRGICLDPEDPIIAWPSVIHDYLYTCQGTLPDGFTYTREQADAVLREAMEVCGAGHFIRESVYEAVENFGSSHWGRGRETSALGQEVSTLKAAAGFGVNPGLVFMAKHDLRACRGFLENRAATSINMDILALPLWVKITMGLTGLLVILATLRSLFRPYDKRD